MYRRAAAAAAVACAALAAASAAAAMNSPNPRLAQPVVPLPGTLEAPGPVLSQPVLALPSAASEAQPRLAVSLSTGRAGARNVALTIRFKTFLRCGKPMGAVVVTLPPAASVPGRVAPSAVRVNGARAGSVSVRGHSLTILPHTGGITCDSIVDGTALVSIGAGAGLGNPVQPGSYAVRVTHGTESYRATIVIGR